MATHLAAWFEALDSATLAAINALTDDRLNRPTTERYLVPANMNHIHWAAALGINLTRARLDSTSIGTKRMDLDIVPRVNGDDAFEGGQVRVMRFKTPFALIPTEHIEAQAAEDAAGASNVYALVSIGPAQLPPVPSGDIRRVRATGTTTLTANAWTTCVLTPETTLEPGTYALVGFIPVSATGIAARVNCAGSNYMPGMPVIPGTEATGQDFLPSAMDDLMLYEMGRFDHNTFPEFQFLASAGDTAQTVQLLVVKVG